MELIFKLLELRANATPGVWGPTTSAPTDEETGKTLAKGERGKPTWGAVVSDTETPRECDHPRYADPEYLNWEEPGADYYGGTLVGESFRDGNGEYIAEMHNALPKILNALGDLRICLIKSNVHPVVVDKIIEDAIKNG